MRTATRSHLLPHASPDPPHYVDLAYFVSQESFAVDPYVHGVTIKQYCLNLANNSSSKLVTTLVDCPSLLGTRWFCQPLAYPIEGQIG